MDLIQVMVTILVKLVDPYLVVVTTLVKLVDWAYLKAFMESMPRVQNKQTQKNRDLESLELRIKGEYIHLQGRIVQCRLQYPDHAHCIVQTCLQSYYELHALDLLDAY